MVFLFVFLSFPSPSYYLCSFASSATNFRMDKYDFAILLKSLSAISAVFKKKKKTFIATKDTYTLIQIPVFRRYAF
jgi:hypothetical protein